MSSPYLGVSVKLYILSDLSVYSPYFTLHHTC